MIDPELKLREPFTLSIEPTEGKSYLHPFHLGTDGAIAREFAREVWTRVNKERGCVTVALIREGKLYDVWDGVQWHNALVERAFGDIQEGVKLTHDQP